MLLSDSQFSGLLLKSEGAHILVSTWPLPRKASWDRHTFCGWNNVRIDSSKVSLYCYYDTNCLIYTARFYNYQLKSSIRGNRYVAMLLTSSKPRVNFENIQEQASDNNRVLRFIAMSRSSSHTMKKNSAS